MPATCALQRGNDRELNERGQCLQTEARTQLGPLATNTATEARVVRDRGDALEVTRSKISACSAVQSSRCSSGSRAALPVRGSTSAGKPATEDMSVLLRTAVACRGRPANRCSRMIACCRALPSMQRHGYPTHPPRLSVARERAGDDLAADLLRIIQDPSRSLDQPGAAPIFTVNCDRYSAQVAFGEQCSKNGR